MASSLRLHPELQGKVIRLELVGPDGVPRLSASLLDELDRQLDRLLDDSTCEGVVIHGSEKCFAAGAEIAEVGALTGMTALPFARRGQLLFERIASAPKPIIAALRGHCLGGGFDLALACPLRLASPDAVLGHPGVTLGLFTGWGGTQRLPQLVGRGRTLELLLRGEPITAQRALALGLVDAVVPLEELLREAVAWALRMTPQARALR